MQDIPFDGMTAVEPGGTSASINPASAPLVTVPRKRALAHMVVRVCRIFYFGSTCVNPYIIQDIESDFSEVSELTNDSSISFNLINHDSQVIATETRGGLRVSRVTCFNIWCIDQEMSIAKELRNTQKKPNST